MPSVGCLRQEEATRFQYSSDLLECAGRLGEMLKDIVCDDHIKLTMMQNVGPENVVAVIPQNQTIFKDNLTGKELQTTLKEIDPICRLIAELKNNREVT